MYSVLGRICSLKCACICGTAIAYPTMKALLTWKLRALLTVLDSAVRSTHLSRTRHYASVQLDVADSMDDNIHGHDQLCW